MPDHPPQASRIRGWITERISRSSGPLLRLRATRFGIDVLRGDRPEIEFYYEAGDPHSHLAAQILPALQQSTPCPVRVRLVGDPEAVLYPEAERQRGFALTDCQRIAPAHGLEMPQTTAPPSAEARQLASRILLAALRTGDFVAREREVVTCLFAEDVSGLQALAAGQDVATEAETLAELQENGARRRYLGHYLPAMWQFRGDWYWGIDRLGYLQSALQAAGCWHGPEQLVSRDPALACLSDLPSPLPPLEFFFSFRSPYSYLAAIQLRAALDDLGIELHVRPVLPMAMRGLQVPRCKRLYIVRDVRREADRLGIPFGNIADPLGAGAERCLDTFRLAGDARRQLAFCCEAGAAIWSRGVDVATDEGLRYVCERAGIPWQRARDNLSAGSDLGHAEENRAALFEAGYWGVPCYRVGSFTTWGRDRFWLVRELVRRQRPGN